MIVKVRKIGNSVGVLLSKSIMAQCDIKDEVSVEVKDKSIIIQSVRPTAREGWEQQFLNAGSLNSHEDLMGSANNSFDEEEWTWA